VRPAPLTVSAVLRPRVLRALGAAALCAGLAGCSGHHRVDSTSPAQTGAVGAVPSAGCKAATPAPSVTGQRDAIAVAGTSRTYLLTTPPAHRQPDPLVVDFHGFGEGAPTESLTTGFGTLGQRDGFVAVFPSGTGTPIAWDTSTKAGNPDLRFVAALLGRLEATQCIDEARVYATGLSQGAFMTSTVACVMSRTFAAVAPVAGVQLPRHCPTERPVPLLAFHGTADPILHFNGGIGRKVLAADIHAHPRPLPKQPAPHLFGAGYPANVRAWAVKDGCGTTPTDTRVSAHVIHRSYPCPPGVEVEFDIIVGGGHSWPGSPISAAISAFVGHTTMEINATNTIWAFFRGFHLAHPLAMH